jgi:hypothetical protein
VEEILEQHGISDPATRERLVRASRGSPGTALMLADPDLESFRNQFLDGLCKPIPDATELGKLWGDFVEAAGKDSASQRGRAQQVLRLLIDFLEDALEISVGGDARRTGPEDQGRAQELAERMGTGTLLEILDRCLEADQQIDRRVQLVLVLEAFLDAWSQKMPVRAGR